MGFNPPNIAPLVLIGYRDTSSLCREEEETLNSRIATNSDRPDDDHALGRTTVPVDRTTVAVEAPAASPRRTSAETGMGSTILRGGVTTPDTISSFSKWRLGL